jgi:hypothetical protein
MAYKIVILSLPMTQIYIDPKGYYDYLQRLRPFNDCTYEIFLAHCEIKRSLSGIPPTLVLKLDDISPELMERFTDACDEYNGVPPWMLPDLLSKTSRAHTGKKKAEQDLKILKSIGEISFSRISLNEHDSREGTIKKHDLELQQG